MKTKNKTRYLQSILGALLAVSAALVLSCEQPDGSSVGAPVGKGSVVLSASLGNTEDGPVLKTILPTEKPDFTRYELVFSKGDGEGKVTVTPPNPGGVGDEGYVQDLDVGSWTVTVTAFRKFTVTTGTEEEYAAATGSDTFDVSPGETTDVEVTLYPIPIDESKDLNGIFIYTVSLAEDLKDAGVTVTELTLDNDDLTSGFAFGTEYSIDKTPGYYDLTIVLTKDGLTATVFGKVHIYAGLESEANFTFTAADFVEYVYLAGTYPDKGTWTNPTITVATYGDSPVDATPVTLASGWAVKIEADKAVDETLYIKAVAKDGAGFTYTSIANTGGAVTEAGKRDIALGDPTVKAPAGEEGNPAEVTADALQTAIEAVSDGGELTLGNVTITNPGTATMLPLGAAKVTVEKGLTVPENVTLTVDGGELNVAAEASVTVSGAADLSKAESVVVSGELTVASTGALKVATPGSQEAAEAFFGPNGSGSLVLEKGSTLSRQNGEVEELYVGVTNDYIYQWSGETGELVLAKNSQTLASGTLIVTQDESIQTGYTATIADGAELQIADDATFTMRGTLNVAEGGDVTVTGELIVADGSNGDLKGTITVADGGVSRDLNSGGGSLWKDAGSTGEYLFEAGSKAYVYDSDYKTEFLIIGGGNDDAAIKLAAGATFTNSQTAYTLNGDATIAQTYLIGSKEVTIENGTLTVAADLTLYDGTTLTGATGAKIVLTEGKTITGAANFYNAAGTVIDTAITATSDETYDWDGGKSGWLKEATWTAAADGETDYTTSTKITLTFSREITGLAATDITITGNATKGGLTGNGTTYDLAITGISAEETVTVSIAKTGIEKDSTEGTVTLHYSTKGKQGLGVEADGLEDEDISITGLNGDISWSAKTALTVGVTLDEGTPSAYRWELDGKPVGTDNNSLTGTTRQLGDTKLTVGKHSLTVFVTIDGVEYTKRTTFTVGK